VNIVNIHDDSMSATI